MKKLVVLFNPNTNSATTAEMVAIAREAAGSWARVEGRTADFGPPVIVNPSGLALASLAVEAFADRMEEGGWPADGIVIGAFGDPGLETLKTRAPIPVVGIGESAIAQASAHGRAFSIVSTTPELETSIRQQVEAHGVAGQLRSLRMTPGIPSEVMADAERLDRELALLITEVTAGDASQCVLVAGGPLSAAALRLDRRFALPIIDPVTTALRRLGCMLHHVH